MPGILAVEGVEKEVGVPVDDGQEVVEVVRDAARQQSHGLHLLGLAQLFVALAKRQLGLAAVGNISSVNNNPSYRGIVQEVRRQSFDCPQGAIEVAEAPIQP